MTRGPGPQVTLTLHQRQVPLAYLALLPAPADELSGIVDQALATNPMLERRAGGPCISCGRHCGSGGLCAACSLHRIDEGTLAQSVPWREALETDARLELPASLHPLLAIVVGSLDDRGLFPREGPDSPTLVQVIDGLRVVGPPGIAARSTVDCVLVQVQELVEHGELPARAASLTAEDLREGLGGHATEGVRSLLREIASLVTPYVTLPDSGRTPALPDIRYAQATDGRLTAEVTNAAWFGLVIDDSTWLAADAGARAWLAPYRTEARLLLDRLAARAGLLQRLADWLGEEQREFVQHGPARHRPLTRVAASRALGCHPATIGRVVAGKVARCPDGRCLSLSAFFGGRTAILEDLRRLARDDPGATDDQLAQRLATLGHPIARRTVSKYRALLGIATHR